LWGGELLMIMNLVEVVRGRIGKRGFIALDFLGWLILGVVVLVIIMFVIMVFLGKWQGAFEFIKDLFRWG